MMRSGLVGKMAKLVVHSIYSVHMGGCIVKDARLLAGCDVD